MRKSLVSVWASLWLAGCWFGVSPVWSAQPLIPGTGQKLTQVGDDFEDPKWSFTHNMPKSSEEQDERKRLPSGWSGNQRWYEGIKRGQPDVIERVPVPEGGLEGSKFALLLKTRQSGVPGSLSNTMQQDDFVCNVAARLGGNMLVSQQPSVVVRVYVPPFDQWEQRNGASFGFRLSLDTHAYKAPEGEKRKRWIIDPYWPGMFAELQRGRGDKQPTTAYWRIRGDQMGRDFRGPQIKEPGWWTLGMSVTPDGQVHYYIRQGIGDLTAENFVTSQFPYGYKAERFKTFFFNVCNRDDGRTWSTPWIVDDPSVYFIPTSRTSVAQRPVTGNSPNTSSSANRRPQTRGR